MRLDRVVLWAEDPLRTVAFFQKVVGLEPVRFEEFKAKKVPFPSVRISDDSIIDIVPKARAAEIDIIPGANGTAGHPANHICLAMTQSELEALAVRLEANGTPAARNVENSYGARGSAPRAFYFRDPDGNILEARYYAELPVD